MQRVYPSLMPACFRCFFVIPIHIIAEKERKSWMAGFQEILILVAIVLGLFFIPRITSKKPASRPVESKKKISGKMRIAIAATIIYPVFPVVYFQPWQRNLTWLALFGIIPVVGWLAVWVYAGFRK